MKIFRLVIALLPMLLAGSSGCRLQAEKLPVVMLRRIADGFTSPVALIDPGEGSRRMYVVDQIGLIWILADGRRVEKPFLDLRTKIIELNSFYEERGLLGLAFHPDFDRNGRFYVSYSGQLQEGLPEEKWDHTTYISEFTVSAGDADQAEPHSERILLAIDKPGYNYEAGHIAFGPDGYLYVATGDSVRDPALQSGRYAQDKASLLGKILRIDVDRVGDSGGQYSIPPDNPFASGDGLPEIFAYGFRNPYRFTFDVSESGKTRLLVADVGQALMEEVSIVEAGGNYGWPIREGTSCFNMQMWDRPLESCPTAGFIEPIFAYTHTENLSAIIGGGVYRGASLAQLDGRYLFGDWGKGEGRLFAASPPPLAFLPWAVEEIQVELPEDQTGLGQLLGIGQDRAGEFYLLTKASGIGATGTSGAIYQIVPAGP